MRHPLFPVVGENVVSRQTRHGGDPLDRPRRIAAGHRTARHHAPDKLKVEGGGINLAPFQQAHRALPQIKDVLARTSGSPASTARRCSRSSTAPWSAIDVVDQAGPLLDTAELLPIALRMVIETRVHEPLEDPIFAMTLRNEVGHTVFSASTDWQEIETGGFTARPEGHRCASTSGRLVRGEPLQAHAVRRPRRSGRQRARPARGSRCRCWCTVRARRAG